MYSQNDEERVILEYFGDRKGTFLSIGENDGTTFSNVRALAERSWSGICIEPSPKAFKRLSSLYTNNRLVDTYKLAIATYDGVIVLHESGNLVSQQDTSLVSTVIPEEKKRFEGAVQYEAVEVQCATWQSFSEDLPYKAHDVISIDAEGMDLDILKQMQTLRTLDFASLVCIEWNGDEELAKEYSYILMRDQGMHLRYTSGENLIYVR
jgi:FkbM family methyltransferase